jgi:hypothetical protein
MSKWIDVVAALNAARSTLGAPGNLRSNDSEVSVGKMLWAIDQALAEIQKDLPAPYEKVRRAIIAPDSPSEFDNGVEALDRLVQRQQQQIMRLTLELRTLQHAARIA